MPRLLWLRNSWILEDFLWLTSFWASVFFPPSLSTIGDCRRSSTASRYSERFQPLLRRRLNVGLFSHYLSLAFPRNFYVVMAEKNFGFRPFIQSHSISTWVYAEQDGINETNVSLDKFLCFSREHSTSVRLKAGDEKPEVSDKNDNNTGVY